MNNQQGDGAPADIVNSAKQGLGKSVKTEDQKQKDNENLVPSAGNNPYGEGAA